MEAAIQAHGQLVTEVARTVGAALVIACGSALAALLVIGVLFGVLARIAIGPWLSLFALFLDV